MSHTTFHHLDQKRAVKEAKRVLKRGGKLAIVDVTREQNIIKKKIEKIFLRYLWSMGMMAIKYGIRQTIKAWQYSEGPEWRKHVNVERHVFLTKKEYKDFYSKLLPGAKFGVANYTISYLVWTKS